MKKTLALAVGAILALPLGQAFAAKPKVQKVEGTIAIPQPQPADGVCVYRTQRSLFSFAGDQINGQVGYTFEVDPKTVGKPFKLDVADGAGMDIAFYADLGDPTDPTTAPANIAFENPGPGGEKGKVPAGFPYVFVCMTEGQNATFTYTAKAGRKK